MIAGKFGEATARQKEKVAGHSCSTLQLLAQVFSIIPRQDAIVQVEWCQAARIG